MTATLYQLTSRFFRSHMAGTFGYSHNTIASYSKCILLLLCFAARQWKVTPGKLSIEDVSDTVVLEFLEHLAKDRGNSARTRRQRLTAIKTFFRFLALHEPVLMEACERVQAIRIRVPPPRPMTVLNTKQAEAICQAPDPKTVLGLRDQAILLLLYNSGIRVQELCDLSMERIRLQAPTQIEVIGKGHKQRLIPIWPETVKAIESYLRACPRDRAPDSPLFLGLTNRPLARFGVRHMVRRHTVTTGRKLPDLDPRRVSPHTFRHTTATCLLDSHADIVTVRDWLGHSDIRTTMVYTHIDMEAKRRALGRCPAPSVGTPPETPQWTQPDVLDFLRQLSRTGGVMLHPKGRPALRPPATDRQ